MKILIAGCGKVGETLTAALSEEGYDLTLIDKQSEVLSSVMEKYDIMSVQGNCASIRTLKQADVEKADLLIACTNSDEVNLLCCMTAHGCNKKLHTIARIRNPEYTEQAYDMRDEFALSMLINPELQAATEIERLLKYPGFLKRDSFAKGKVEIVELKLEEENALCDVMLKDISSKLNCRVLICAVLRDGVSHIPNGRFLLKEGDRIFVTASPDNLSTMLKNLGLGAKKIRRVMIAGGGTIAYYLADLLKSRSVSVEIIEKNLAQCEELASAFPHVTVIHGDVGDRDSLISEGLASCDSLISLTGSDEMNLVVSLYGNTLHIPQIITKVSDMDNSEMTNTLPLGSLISPKKLCSNSVVRYVRAMESGTGAAVTIHTIADGQVEAAEFCIDKDTAHAGEPLRTLKIRENIRIASISHGSKTVIPGGDSTFVPGDRVVIVSQKDAAVHQFNDIFD